MALLICSVGEAQWIRKFEIRDQGACKGTYACFDLLCEAVIGVPRRIQGHLALKW
jgi:hypothetical protein